MTDVRWSAGIEDAPALTLAKDHLTILPPWAASAGNVEQTVAKVVESWLEYPDDWRDLFGDDDNAHLIVEIHQPAAIMGRYRVEAERVIKARGVARIKDAA